MKQRIFCISLVMLLIISAMMFSGCVQEQKTAEKSYNEVALDVVTFLQNKNYSGVYGLFNTSITSQITVEQFQSLWEQQVITPNGNITKIIHTRSTNQSGYRIIFVTCNFSKQNTLDIKVIFNNQTLVVGLTVVPTEVTYVYKPPAYVNLSLFSEMNVTVGSGEWQLPGTLSVPIGDGPFPAVVLVQGSGPNDRDETVGPNKPFKDVAWGLASKGIVVLRYEKRTKQYPAQCAAIQNFTIQDEVIDDAIAAVALLNSSAVVNHSQIFVLGHSLGGMVAPRIGAQDHRLAGLIILAGPTRHLEDLMLEQTRYLANLSGTNQSEQIAALEIEIQKIKTLNISQDENVLGGPRSYWADLAVYDPVEAAESLTLPLLILQGQRDYQVTMTDFTRWNDTFFGTPTVTLKTYPLLNHLFIAGTGVPTNTEYLVEGHVDEAVIVDIVSWIT